MYTRAGTNRHLRCRTTLLLALTAAGVVGCSAASNGTQLPGAETGTVTGTTVRLGSLQVRDALIEAPRAGESYPDGGIARMGLTLANDGPQADLLQGVQTPIAGSTQMFADTTPDDPSYRPEPVSDVNAVPASSDQPSETPLYVELRDLKTSAREGQAYPVTLRFARAGTVQISVPVEIPKEP